MRRSAKAVAPPDIKDSLVRRLTRLNLQVLAVTMLLSFGLIAVASVLVARDLQAQGAERNAQVLASSLVPMLVFEDRQAAAAELRVLSQRADLLAVRVVNAAGQTFAEWPETGSTEFRAARATASAQPLPGEYPQAQRTLHLNHVDLSLPIHLKGERVGSLQLRESLKKVQMAALRLVALAALLIAVSIGLAAWLLQWVQSRALAPIVELSDLAEHIATTQDYSRRASVHRADEVGRLSQRFNQLLGRVETSQAELNQQIHQEQISGQKFEQLAHRDSLTQLPNRLYFQAALERHVATSCQEVLLLALMFIDLDNFKTVNDRHGHDAGDEVLRQVALRMGQVIRADDVLCRLGGDEFALILPVLPDEQVAEQLALRLIAAIREPLLVNGQVMPIGATVGMAFCPTDEVDAPNLLGTADAAMYAAKRAGKNTFRKAAYVGAF